VLAAGLPARWSKALVVVDDCSAPGESRVLEALVERLQQQGNRIELQRHQRNQGKGAALRTGFDRVLGAGPPEDDLVIIQDADLEYDPADYSALMEPLLRGKADAVVGCRFGAHRTLRGAWPRLHAAANRLLTRLSNLATGYRLRDMECCYKLVPVGLLRRLRGRLSESRYGVEPQLVAALAALGARVAEVPVRYDPRSAAEGKKIGWKDGVRAIYVIAAERLRRGRR
jgi:glycosyltransferase involved in cell wall biosynthesis